MVRSSAINAMSANSSSLSWSPKCLCNLISQSRGQTSKLRTFFEQQSHVRSKAGWYCPFALWTKVMSTLLLPYRYQISTRDTQRDRIAARETSQREAICRPTVACPTIVTQDILAFATSPSKQDSLDVCLIDENTCYVWVRYLARP